MSTEANDSDVDHYEVGTRVHLCGLQKAAHLNGRFGTVSTAEEFSRTGRYGVTLEKAWIDPAIGIEKHEPLAIKPCNLRHAPEMTVVTQVPCGFCNSLILDEKSFFCGKCKLIQYCSEKCQKRHWKKEHRVDCGRLRAARKANSDDGLSVDPKQRAHEHVLRGVQYMSSGDAVAAEAEFRASLSTWCSDRDSIQANAVGMLGLALQRQGKTQEAIQCIEKAIRLRGSDPGQRVSKANNHSNLAFILREERDFAGAAKHFRSWAELDPDNSEPHVWEAYGECCLESGDNEETITALSRFISLNPGGDAQNSGKYFVMTEMACPDFPDLLKCSNDDIGQLLQKVEESNGYIKKATELDSTEADYQRILGLGLKLESALKAVQLSDSASVLEVYQRHVDRHSGHRPKECALTYCKMAAITGQELKRSPVPSTSEQAEQWRKKLITTRVYIDKAVELDPNNSFYPMMRDDLLGLERQLSRAALPGQSTM